MSSKLETESRNYEFLLNKTKTRIMIIYCTTSRTKTVAGFELVRETVYLGSLITYNGKFKVRCRISKPRIMQPPD